MDYEARFSDDGVFNTKFLIEIPFLSSSVHSHEVTEGWLMKWKSFLAEYFRGSVCGVGNMCHIVPLKLP